MDDTNRQGEEEDCKEKRTAVAAATPLRIAVGEPTTTFVVTDDGVVAPQLVPPGSPQRAVPVKLDMGHPIGRFDQWWALPVHRVGEPHLVSRLTEPDGLAHHTEPKGAVSPRAVPTPL
jgi:hypothetical protein